MDGTEPKKVDYFEKANNINLIPKATKNTSIYTVANNPAFYQDLHDKTPIVVIRQWNSNHVLVADSKSRTYKNLNSTDPAVQRACRNLILKNSLKNL